MPVTESQLIHQGIQALIGRDAVSYTHLDVYKRQGKRTGLAAVRFAVEMEKEGLISWQEAVQRVPAEQLDQVLAPVFDRSAVKAATAIAKGLPAGPGAATGRIYFNACLLYTSRCV